jgi:hypothetical protein
MGNKGGKSKPGGASKKGGKSSNPPEPQLDLAKFEYNFVAFFKIPECRAAFREFLIKTKCEGTY